MGMVKECWAMTRGVALGAGLMYLLDPVAGRRRRAMIRDKAVSTLYDAEDLLEGGVEDLANRARGAAAEAISAVRKDPISDQTLHDRIRAMMGRIVSHPRAIEVCVDCGRVTLSGAIFSDEAPKLIYAVSGMRGVNGVENLLEKHGVPTDHPALQGHAASTGPQPEFLQTYWTDGPRLVACLAGCALVLRGARAGGALGLTAALGGIALMSEAAERTPKADQPKLSKRRSQPESEIRRYDLPAMEQAPDLMEADAA